METKFLKPNIVWRLNRSTRLVLVSQDCLLNYMKKEFSFSDIGSAKIGNSMHFHSYSLDIQKDKTYKLELVERLSTDSEGLAKSLGLKAEANIELEEILSKIQSKISKNTLLTI